MRLSGTTVPLTVLLGSCVPHRFGGMFSKTPPLNVRILRCGLGVVLVGGPVQVTSQTVLPRKPQGQEQEVLSRREMFPRA